MIHERQAEYEPAFALLADALALLGEQTSIERIRILLVGAGLYQRQGDYQETIRWAEQALALALRLAIPHEQAHAYKLLGTAHALPVEP